MKAVYVIDPAPLDEQRQQAGQAHTPKCARSKLAAVLAVSRVISATTFLMY
jgi:hypothetical protein